MPRFKTTVKIKSDLKGLKNLSKRLQKDQSLLAEVGHFGAKPHPTRVGNTIAGVSLINQMGYTAENGRVVPARPYMTIALQSLAYLKRYEQAVERIAISKSTIAVELPKLGKFLEEIMAGVIVASLGLAKIAQATIDKKGFDHPLMETGTLVNDIQSRIVNDVSRR